MFKPKRPLSSAQSHDAKLRDLVLPKAVNPAPKFNFVPVGFPFPVVKKPKFIYPYEPSVLDRSASRWFASQSQEGSPPPWANKLEILVANIKPEE